MKSIFLMAIPLIFWGSLPSSCHSQESPERNGKSEASSGGQANPERPRRGAFGGPIELGPDDVAYYEAPPEGFKTVRDNIPHGALELIEYESTTVGTTRKANVYTPPGYSKETRYPLATNLI